MNLWLTPTSVRDAVGLGSTGGRYSDDSIGSNIRAAQTLIERQAQRQFEQQDGVTKVFSTEGRASMAIPDLRTVTSATSQGIALVADSTYWLIPDAMQTGVYVAIQLRPYAVAGPHNYKSNPEWFDRNLDSPWYWMGGSSGGLPNDLSITGNWGWVDKPFDLLNGVKALAAWLTKRYDAVLAGAMQEPATGAIYDYTQWPPEAQNVISTYRRGEMAAIIR